MFGFVNANFQELSKAQQARYSAIYCGICQAIRLRSGNLARITLSYDMAFLALLHLSLYEPQEKSGRSFCALHPLKPRPWVESPQIQYAADMNVALAYYKALDDCEDEGSRSAKLLANALAPHYHRIEQQFPRQCAAIADCIGQLRQIENRNESNPDIPASCFGQLMAELMVYQEDLWAEDLRSMGFHLGRFIYLADAMLDYDRDIRKKQYNPFLAQGQEKDKWEEYLLLAMGSCTESYEKLPLVQDKPLLDNILYSGVWVQYRRKNRKEAHSG